MFPTSDQAQTSTASAVASSGRRSCSRPFRNRGEASPSLRLGESAKATLPLRKSVPKVLLPAALARLRDKARQCRKAAWTMKPSPARSALERVALRWEVIAEAERRQVERTTAANDI